MTKRLKRQGIYARLYASINDDPELLMLSDRAFRVWVRALPWSRERVTDGVVTTKAADFLSSQDRAPIDELVEAGLWEPIPEGWYIVGYDECQETSDDIERLSNAGKKGNEVRWKRHRKMQGNIRIGSRSDPIVIPSESESESELTTVVPSLTRRDNGTFYPSALVEEVNAKSKIPLSEKTRTGDEETVFTAWKKATGKEKSRLDPKRRKCITRALANYPLGDVLAATRGWRHSPHHRGENERHTIYNDLTLLLRDADHIEKFRDLELFGAPPRSNGAISIGEAVATAERLRREGR